MNLPSDHETVYTLEIVAQLSGVSTATISHYKEQGFIRPLPTASDEQSCFDDEALRTLRRIEHLRSTFGMNDDGLKLILSLMNEVDRLRAELRARR